MPKTFIDLNIFFFISFLIILNTKSTCCSVYCKLPVALDNNTYIGEGSVVGYIGNFTQKDIEGEYGLLQVAVRKLYNPSVKQDTIYISIFGLGSGCETLGTSIEYLKQTYPLNQLISFIGNKSKVIPNSVVHVNVGVCGYIYKGSMQERMRYDYESLRKSPALDERIENNLDLIEEDLLSKNEHWGGRELFKIAEVAQKLAKELIVPEIFQIYLDIVEINQSNSKEVRFYILRRLIWSPYVRDEEFITKQKITKKQKSALLKEQAVINETWKIY